MKDHGGSTFVKHVGCDRCGSRDNAGLFSDGHTWCFGCGHHENTSDAPSLPSTERTRRLLDLITGDVRALAPRKITQETCDHFGYRIGEYEGRPCQIAPYFSSEGQLVAQKIRFKDKTFKVLGDLTEALPFGAHAFPKTGKSIVVTEGEIDALSMSQVQGNKWPVVSIACGAGAQIAKYFAKHKPYFEGFERVVLMFDNDEPGQKAAKLAAEVLGSRARLAQLQLKDANEMLCAGKAGDLISAMWNAQPHRPEGLVEMTSLKEAVLTAPVRGLSLPFPEWDAVTHGVRLHELWGFGAGTGIGKTDLFTQIQRWFIEVHRKKIGVFSLEQKPRESATRLAGKLVEKTLHIPDSGWTVDDIHAAFSKIDEGQVFFYDSFGATRWDAIKDKIEYLHHSEGVEYFFLDHLTALAAGDEDDEKTALERIMAELGALVQKLPITIFFISHLATPEGKPHEEGGRVTIRHFKGSRAIGFWAHFLFGLERNQQAEDERERTTTLLRGLKDRYTGRSVGWTMHLGYDRETGMLYPTVNPEEQGPQFHDETNREAQPSDF